MTITAKQLESRRNHLGGSDIAALFGMSPFLTKYDLWLDKTGKLTPEQSTKKHLQLGNDFEPIILNIASRTLGKLRRNQYRSLKPELPLAVNTDAIAEDKDDCPVEGKSNGIFWPVEETWGEPGTDQVPDRVNLQAHAQMMCCRKDTCYVPALFWGLKFELYVVHLDAGIAARIAEAAVDFWQNHIVKDIPPKKTSPSLAVAKRMIRQPNSVCDIEPDLVAAWLTAQGARLAAQKEEDAAKAAVLGALGGCEAGRFADREVTYFEQSRTGYTVKPAKYRVLRTRKVQ